MSVDVWTTFPKDCQVLTWIAIPIYWFLYTFGRHSRRIVKSSHNLLYLFINICRRLDDIPEGLSSPYIYSYLSIRVDDIPEGLSSPDICVILYIYIYWCPWTTFLMDCPVLTWMFIHIYWYLYTFGRHSRRIVKSWYWYIHVSTTYHVYLDDIPHGLSSPYRDCIHI